jgi:hypothetical protein
MIFREREGRPHMLHMAVLATSQSHYSDVDLAYKERWIEWYCVLGHSEA